MELEELDKHPNRIEIFLEVAHQIERDFNRSGIPLVWTIEELHNIQLLINKLKNVVEELYNSDRAKLSALIYTVDISQYTINKHTNRPNAMDMPAELAKLILQRCLQKVILRKYYS